MTIASMRRKPYPIRLIHYYKQCFQYLIRHKSFAGFTMYKIGVYLKDEANRKSMGM